MPTESLSVSHAGGATTPASRRILRLAVGTAASLAVSQYFAWPLSFLAPVFTMFILALPLPAPGLKAGIGFVIALLAPVVLGMAFLPLLEYARWAGIAAVALALYFTFYFTARGGSPVMGMFMTVGLTLVVTVGSVSIDAMVALLKGLAAGAVFGMAFVWLGHAVFPEPPRPGPKAARAQPPVPDRRASRLNAWRSWLITFPVALLFLFSSASPSYTVVMIKVATMGQQANTDHSRAMAKSLLESTLIGGAAAVVAWQLLSIWPSLILYVLLIALAALLFGARVFQGPALHPKASTWSYAFLTMMVILAPAVTDSHVGSDAGSAFYSRLWLFIVIALYGTVSVAVFDAFFDRAESG